MRLIVVADSHFQAFQDDAAIGGLVGEAVAEALEAVEADVIHPIQHHQRLIKITRPEVFAEAQTAGLEEAAGAGAEGTIHDMADFRLEIVGVHLDRKRHDDADFQRRFQHHFLADHAVGLQIGIEHGAHAGLVGARRQIKAAFGVESLACRPDLVAVDAIVIQAEGLQLRLPVNHRHMHRGPGAVPAFPGMRAQHQRMFFQAGFEIGQGDHAVLVVDGARAVETRLIHLFRVIQPPVVEAFDVAARVGDRRGHIERRLFQAFRQAEGVVADQFQQAA